jgi:ASC-1-like (ASCH) protein
MIINWEKEIETCERIERSLEEFLNIYKEHWTKVEETELQFVRITIKAIEECL